jgi:hypothetical protein
MRKSGDCADGRFPGGDELPSGRQFQSILLRRTVHIPDFGSSLMGVMNVSDRDQVLVEDAILGGTCPQTTRT